jgi:hypothetical protein
MRQFFVFAMCVISLASCRDKVMCPAYQSAYILDDSVRNTYYSYLWKLDENTRLNYLAGNNASSSQNTSVATVVDTSNVVAAVPVDTTGISSPLDSGVMVASNKPQTVDYFAYVQPYTVEPREVNKTKNGIIKAQPYWLKNYRLRTAPKENVLAPPPIVEQPIETGEFVASDFVDSASSDSTQVMLVSDSVMLAQASVEEDSFEIPKLAQVEPPKPKSQVKFLYRFDPADDMLNVEQAYYNKHFGHLLYTRVAVQEPVSNEESIADSVATGGGIKGFFQNLFKGGKNKNDLTDEVVDEEPLEEEPPLEEPTNEEPVNEGVIEEDPNDGF